MRRSEGFWFACELVAAAIILAVLLCLAIVTNARATGVTNILLGAGSAGALPTTITIGNGIVSGGGPLGYESSISLGSLSPDTIGAYTIDSLFEEYSSGIVASANVAISPCVPDQNWLGDVIFNGHTFSGSAASYSCSSGVSEWTWTTSGGWAFSLTGGTMYSGTVGHQ